MKIPTVHHIIKKIKGKGSPLPLKNLGRPTKIDERDLRHLEHIIRADPFASYDQLRLELSHFHVNVSRNTVISYCKSLGFGSYSAAHKPALTPKHRDRRLRWAKERVNWTVDQWRGVVWSDESRFTIEGSDGDKRVIRKIGERYDAKNVVPTTKYGGGGVMIWSCFWAGGFGPLVQIDGTVNQDAYINILAGEFHPWFTDLHEKENRDFIFQEDGASCHTGGYARWWKENHQIRGFEYWPAQSPDLNPIEHVWWALERRIASRRAAIKDIPTLKAVLAEEWEKVGLELAQRLVESMTDRCKAVIEAKGGHTKY